MTGASDVEILREAAARMRALAEATYLKGPWRVDPEDHDFDPMGGPHVRYYSRDSNYTCSVAYGVWPENAEHIAAWTPEVALAVAELLDWAAAGSEHIANTTGGSWSGAKSALAVARAFLGTTP